MHTIENYNAISEISVFIIIVLIYELLVALMRDIVFPTPLLKSISRFEKLQPRYNAQGSTGRRTSSDLTMK